MKKTRLKHRLFYVLLTCFLAPAIYGQSPKQLIEEIKQLLLDHYIFFEKAQEVSESLDQWLEQGEFDGINREEELAAAFTQKLQEVTNDKHLVVYPPRQVRVEEKPELAFMRSLSRYRSPMIKAVQLLEDNVGYLDLRFFGGGESSWEKIDQVMQQLEPADALIVVLRYNGGGSISTVQYLNSYFFEVELATIQEDYNLESYKENLQAFKERQK